MRYASGIVGREGIKLFHGLVFLFIGAFSLNILLIWPIRYNLDGSQFLDTIKGKICMEKSLINNSSNNDEDVDQVELSIKPKLMIFALTTVFWGLGQFYFWSAIKARLIINSTHLLSSSNDFFSKFFDIRRIQQSLMSLRLHNVLANLIALNLVADQIKNILLQTFDSELGKEMTFNIWWTSFVVENLGISNILEILYENIVF